MSGSFFAVLGCFGVTELTGHTCHRQRRIRSSHYNLLRSGSPISSRYVPFTTFYKTSYIVKAVAATTKRTYRKMVIVYGIVLTLIDRICLQSYHSCQYHIGGSEREEVCGGAVTEEGPRSSIWPLRMLCDY